MAIAKNDYLEIVTDEATGERKLFGKCGYTIVHKGTDKYTVANMAAIERAMKAGELTDIDGNVATDGCVIQTLSRITLIKSADEMTSVATIRTLAGDTVDVPAAPAPVAGAQPNPFS